MSYTAYQWKVIAWSTKRYELKLQLSAFPNIRGVKPDGTVFEESIITLTAWYKNYQAQERRKKQEARRHTKERA